MTTEAAAATTDADHDLPGSSVASRSPFVREVTTAIGVSVLSFAVLRPDWYYIQNGLDPLFYTGYAQNFDDILPAIDTKRYFVSRWSLYLPSRAFDALFGATTGFVVMRLALLALLLTALLHFAREWTMQAKVLVLVVTLCSPMLVRAVYTDYSDAIVVPGGVVMLCALFARRPSRAAPVVAGVAAGAMAVANPFALTTVSLSVGVWVIWRWPDWRRTAVDLAVMALGAVGVVLCGLVLFRWRYGVADVYAPTIDFLRSFQGGADPLKSPTDAWLSYRLWIYLPPFVVVVGAVLHLVAKIRLERRESAILALAALQYAFQCWYQFARDGSTLEIPYYWSYVLPVYLVSAAIVVRQYSELVSGRTLIAAGATITVVIALLPNPAPSVWPTVLPSLVLVVVLGVVAFAPRLGGRSPIAAFVFFLVVATTVPLASPRPEPRQPTERRVDSAYESAFGSTGSAGQQTFRAATAFGERLDEFGDGIERHLHFWIGGANSWQLAAMYGAPVSLRVINFDANSVPQPTPDPYWDQMVGEGNVPAVAVLGEPDEVDVLVDRLRQLGSPTFVVLDDELFDTPLPTRLVLVQLVEQLPS